MRDAERPTFPEATVPVLVPMSTIMRRRLAERSSLGTTRCLFDGHSGELRRGVRGAARALVDVCVSPIPNGIDVGLPVRAVRSQS
jgi:hypothetical protein